MKRYLIKIIFCIFIGLFSLFLLKECGMIPTTQKSYVYSEDSLRCITVIDYRNPLLDILFFPNENDYAEREKKRKYQGVYFVPGKFQGHLPKSNYVFTNWMDHNNYVRWENDTTYLLLLGAYVKENKLDTTQVVLKTYYSKEELINYGLYSNKDSVYEKIHMQYTTIPPFSEGGKTH
jgi:hypothetical protein